MISAQLLISEDSEELALTLNGKKRKISKEDFDAAMTKAHIPNKAIENLWGRILGGAKNWSSIIDESFLRKEQKKKFNILIDERLSRIK